MIFTLGNLLTILIVFVVLLVYRQLDKNNRTLEKMKRFSDKARDELDRIVAEKATQLKDIAIELDVHQRTAREVLNRIREIEENLNSRASDIEQIGTRIGDYDRVLEELVGMTLKTEENLGRIREESEFVDTVGKRIRAAAGGIEQIEKTIPSLLDEFGRMNGLELERLAGASVEKVEKAIDSFKTELRDTEAHVDGLRAYTVDLTEKTRAFAGETENHLDEIAGELIRRATNEKTEAIAELEAGLASFRNTVELVESDYEERLENVRRQGESLEAEVLATLVERIESDVNATDEKLSASIRASVVHGEELVRAEFSRVTNLLSAAQDRISHDMDEFGARADAWRTGLADGIREIDERFAQSSERSLTLDGEIRSRMAEVVTLVERSESELRHGLEETLRKGNELAEVLTRRFTQELEQRNRVLRETMEEKYTSVQNSLVLSEKELSAQMSSTREQILQWRKNNENVLESYREDIAGEVREFKSMMENRLAEGNASLQTLTELTGRLDEQTDALGVRIGQEDEAIRIRIEESAARLVEAIAQTAAEAQTTALERVENRLEDYETGLTSRFERLDAVGHEIDELESRLQGEIKSTTARMYADFEAFDADLEAGRHTERMKVEQEFASLKASMQELENGLAELKTRAYDNVSEKLKVFEDEFFLNLQQRSDGMESRLTNWQHEVDDTIGSIAATYVTERENMEKAFRGDLKQKLSDLQSRIHQHLEKFEDQVKKYQEGMQAKISVSESSFLVFQQTMREEFDEAKQSSVETFRRELSLSGTRMADQFRKHEKEIEIRLKAGHDMVEAGNRDVAAVLEAAQSDVTIWKAKVLQRMKETETDLGSQFSVLKADALQLVAQLKETLTAEKDELVVASRDERAKLRNDLQQLQDGMIVLENDLRQRTAQSLEAFTRDSETFLLDLQKKMKDFQMEADQRIREYRVAAQDNRDLTESMQKKLHGKIEESYRVLSLNLAEIDKKQKGFIEQTKIFERADSLKSALQENIEELRLQIQDLETRSKELKETESQFQKIRKIADELNAKTARFLAEKRRIDLIEEDFKRLTGLSQAVDTRLGEVMAGNDVLQTIQAKFRSLEELEQDVEKRYDRLEQKRGILDVTTEGIDKNFRFLESLEKEIKSVQDRMNSVPDRLTELDRRMEQLMGQKGRAEDAIRQIQNIDTLLKDIENRTQQLGKVREWLARTETRIEEVSREAEDKVRLLGSILKEDRKSSSKSREKGAPALGARETVVKLAHQGWSIEEIAKVTELSRGEVELILEISPK